MLRKLLSQKRLAAVAFVGVLAVTGAAVAYFTGGSNTVTGSGTVGTSSQWGIALTGTPTFSGNLNAIYPGVGTESIPFTVTNTGNGNQAVTSIVPAVSHDNSGNVISNGAALTGCLASWFQVVDNGSNPALGLSLAPNGTYTGKVVLTMQDVPTSQDACKNATPAVTITAS